MAETESTKIFQTSKQIYKKRYVNISSLVKFGNALNNRSRTHIVFLKRLTQASFYGRIYYHIFQVHTHMVITDHKKKTDIKWIRPWKDS